MNPLLAKSPKKIFYFTLQPVVPLAGAPLADWEKNAIVEEHNKLRRNVQPPAIDMKKMKWDAGLAKLAQDWTAKCQFLHGQPDNKKSTIGPDGKPFGRSFIRQNLAMSELNFDLIEQRKIDIG